MRFKNVVSLVVVWVLAFQMTVFADFVKTDSENEVYYEMYDFSSDVHGTALTREITEGVNSGFILQNTGSGATVYNDGTDAYIAYFASSDNAGVNRLTKFFVNTYTGNEVTLSMKIRTNDIENTGKRIRIYDSDGTDFSVRIPNDAGSFWVTGDYYLSPFNYHDNQWHEIKFVFCFQDKKCNIYFDGTAVTLNGSTAVDIPLKDTFTDVKRIGICADTKGKKIDVDDVQISNIADAIPAVVTSVSNDDGTMSLFAREGDTIKYATGSTSAEALAALSSPGTYSEPIEISDDSSYVAAYSVSTAYATEGLRTVHQYTDKNYATLDVVQHLSPYSVLTTGGLSNTDTLALGVASQEITLSGTVANAEYICDSTTANQAGNYVSADAESYIDIDLSNYNGTKTIRDMKIVFGRVSEKASYSYELYYKKTGGEDFIRFYKSESTDETSYANPVYPTEILTGFGEQITDVGVLRIQFHLAAAVHEIDLQLVSDSETVNAARDTILKQVSIGKLYSDNAIIQRDADIKIHGYGGSKNGGVHVQIIKDSDNSVVRETTTTSEDYKWSVIFDGISGGMDTYTIKAADVSDDTNYAESAGILFGDVFVGSGQSNMEMTLNTVINTLTGIGTDGAVAESERVKTEMDSNAYTAVRIMNQSNTITALSPLEEAYTANWIACDNFENAKGVSAVAYFFAKELYEELNEEIPVGVMLARRGGTKVKAWIPEEYFDVLTYGDSNNELTDYNRSNYLSYRVWTGGYNALVAPLTATNIKGVIWYQGEDDTDIPQSYKKQFNDLVAGWRDKFNNSELSFNVVQLAAYSNSPNNWAAFRQTQMQLWLNDDYNTMVTAIDIGESENIHPGYKAPLGRRLALAAMAKLYDSDKEWSGPLFDSLSRSGDTLVVKFTHANAMAAKERSPYTENFSNAAELTGFEISADGEVWIPAAAAISGDTVIVSGVENPVAVRYAWENYPQTPNLYNDANLPALPFMASINELTNTPAISVDGNTVTISGRVTDGQSLTSNAMLIIAKFKEGILQSVELQDVKTVLNEAKAYSYTTTNHDADEIRVMLVDRNLRPLILKGSK